MNTIRTVSETKRAFYSLHTRPIASIYRRVVEELMVEMHLLSVNAEFSYDPIFGFGVVSAFDRFMQGYRPEADVDSIFNALCRAIGSDPQVYRSDAESLGTWAVNKSLPDLVASLSTPSQSDTAPQLQDVLNRLLNQGQFKYSRLFAIGLYTLLELASPDLGRDEARQSEVLGRLTDALHLPMDKLKKDISLYRINLEKLIQAQQVMSDILQADRKQKERRATEQEPAITPSSASTDQPSDPV